MRTEAPNPDPNRPGFGALSWLGERGHLIQSGAASLALTRTRLRKVLPLLCTPPWALHGDLWGTLEEQRAIREQLERDSTLLGVVDLGPRALGDLQPPSGWQEIVRHTRQITWGESDELPVPKTRLKQERRFLREGGTVRVHASKGWEDVLQLHQGARERKGLAAHTRALESLLRRIKSETWTFTSLASGSNGSIVASGGFVLLPDGTCVYAFGGQKRSPESGRASVAMILAAMRHAQELGCTRFDFGGSQDLGVDQFYAEFGASVVPMKRWVKAPWWFAWCLPRTWRAWTQPNVQL